MHLAYTITNPDREARYWVQPSDERIGEIDIRLANPPH